MRISVLTGTCVARDAISESVCGTMRWLQRGLDADVRLFAYENQFPDLDFTRCQNLGDVLTDAYFNDSDVIFYHFGFFYHMFGALASGNGRAKQVAYFHNVTPKAFMPRQDHGLVDLSIEQIALIDGADSILAVSEFNKRDLVARGISAERIEILPLYVRFGRERRLRAAEREKRPVRLLYVGRFVHSKGVLDLIEAAAILARTQAVPFSATLAGNLDFSNPEYLSLMRRRIEQTGLAGQIALEGSVSSERLQSLYAEADLFVMPSYHEGFCVPVLEAFHAGCVPVASDAGNLPFLVQDLGALYPAGDPKALAAALAPLLAQFERGRPAVLELSARKRPWEDYENAVGALLDAHTYDAFGRRLVQAVEHALADPRPPRCEWISMPERRPRQSPRALGAGATRA